jgi:hypothetical protein
LLALSTSSVDSGFSFTNSDTRCAGARARIVIDRVASPVSSTGRNAIAARPATSAAGWPSSFVPSSQDVFQPPSAYFRKSRPPASTIRRPSRYRPA